MCRYPCDLSHGYCRRLLSKHGSACLHPGLAHASPSACTLNCPAAESARSIIASTLKSIVAWVGPPATKSVTEIGTASSSLFAKCESCYNQILHVLVPVQMVTDGMVGIRAGNPHARAGNVGVFLDKA